MKNHIFKRTALAILVGGLLGTAQAQTYPGPTTSWASWDYSDSHAYSGISTGSYTAAPTTVVDPATGVSTSTQPYTETYNGHAHTANGSKIGIFETVTGTTTTVVTPTVSAAASGGSTSTTETTHSTPVPIENRNVVTGITITSGGTLVNGGLATNGISNAGSLSSGNITTGSLTLGGDTVNRVVTVGNNAHANSALVAKSYVDHLDDTYDERVGLVEGRVENLETGLNTTNGLAQNAYDGVQAANNRIADLNTSVDYRVNAAKTDLRTEFQPAVDAVNGALTNGATAPQTADAGKLTTAGYVEERITNQTSGLRSDVTALDGRVTTVEGTLATTTGTANAALAATGVNAGAIAGLQSDLGQTNTTVAQNGQAISTLQTNLGTTNANLATLDGRVTTEVTRLDGAIVTAKGQAIAQSNAYTDQAVAPVATKAQEAKELAVAADEKATTAITAINDAATSNDAATAPAATKLTTVGYVDAKADQAKNAAITQARFYTDEREVVIRENLTTQIGTAKNEAIEISKGYTDKAIHGLDQKIQGQLQHNDQRARGYAAAAGAGALAVVSAPAEGGIGAAVFTVGGQNAIAIGARAPIGQTGVNVNATVSKTSHSFAGGVGVGYKW